MLYNTKLSLFCLVGSVPPLYREIYDIICPNDERVDHEMFVKVLAQSGVAAPTLSQVRLSPCSNVTASKVFAK